MTWLIVPGTLLLASLLFLLFKRRPPALCPRCRKPGLQTALRIPAPGAKGKSYWSYHRCPACAAKLRCKDDEWTDAPDEEWDRMNLPK